VGDSLVTNYRRPILAVVEDTTPGIHDTLMSACDRYRYELLGCTEYHDNCTDNLVTAMRELGETIPEVPCPLNLFMNVPVFDGRPLEIQPPVCKPNQYIALRAEMDLIVVFSACPQDMAPTNGAERKPSDAHFAVR
ncbi:MAG: urea carboxylase-associated family protein, partial [bacterium]|nr:urea carboxylase-associated family protein [bacterium]